MTKKAKQFLYTFHREILIFLLLFFTLLCRIPEDSSSQDVIPIWEKSWKYKKAAAMPAIPPTAKRTGRRVCFFANADFKYKVKNKGKKRNINA